MLEKTQEIDPLWTMLEPESGKARFRLASEAGLLTDSVHEDPGGYLFSVNRRKLGAVKAVRDTSRKTGAN